MIYVPQKDEYRCYIVYNSDVIRAYKTIPTNDSVVEYRDYYINSNYIYNDSEQSFSRYTTLPHCLGDSELTSNVYYRNDLADILIVFIIMAIVCLYLPIKIFSKLFKRGRL